MAALHGQRKDADMSEPTDYEIVQAMERFGGSFVRGLAGCWYRADDDNQTRLKAAFPEYCAERPSTPASE
jgi:hypothetical protein